MAQIHRRLMPTNLDSIRKEWMTKWNYSNIPPYLKMVGHLLSVRRRQTNNLKLVHRHSQNEAVNRRIRTNRFP